MLTNFQLRWGVEQWVAFLKDKEIPVLPTTQAAMRAFAETADERIAPRAMADFVLKDPYLALKLLRRVEGKRTHTLGRDTTTALAAVLQAGADELAKTALSSSVTDFSSAGLQRCQHRAVIASCIARDWALARADAAADEIALAALLSESGELLLWHFAPELAQKALDELQSGRAMRTLQAQMQAVGFSFKQLTISLVQAWDLPSLITLLIRGSDNLRANIARLAVDTARHIVTHPENPAIPADIINIKTLLRTPDTRILLAALPIPDTYRASVLAAVEGASHETS